MLKVNIYIKILGLISTFSMMYKLIINLVSLYAKKELGGEFIFIIIIVIIWAIATFKSYKTLSNKFCFSEALLPIILIGIISSISLGVNFLYANTLASDGIGVVGFLSDWIIIQDEKWTRHLFWNYFENSLKVNLLLICVYSALKLKKNRQ